MLGYRVFAWEPNLQSGRLREGRRRGYKEFLYSGLVNTLAAFIILYRYI